MIGGVIINKHAHSRAGEAAARPPGSVGLACEQALAPLRGSMCVCVRACVWSAADAPAVLVLVHSISPHEHPALLALRGSLVRVPIKHAQIIITRQPASADGCIQ